MKQNFTKKITGVFGLLFVVSFLVLAVFPLQAAALTPKERCDAYKKQFQLTSGQNITTGYPVYCSGSDLIVQVINYALIISGSVTILFLIVGGFWYLTSAGNEEQTEKGKKTIINSVIGLVVIILSATIVRVVASTLTLGK